MGILTRLLAAAGLRKAQRLLAEQLWTDAQRASAEESQRRLYATTEQVCRNLVTTIGDNKALYILGRMHEEGLGNVSKDTGKALDLYLRAALQDSPDVVPRLEGLAAMGGNPKTHYVLGIMYERGLGGLPKDANKAVDLYELAAVQGVWEVVPRLEGLAGPGGSAQACYALGKIHEEGLVGVATDANKALDFYEQAAVHGLRDVVPRLEGLAARGAIPKACYVLGKIYEDGIGGVGKDTNKAVVLYEQAADQGIADTVPRLQSLSAQVGHPRAHYVLGKMYEKGLGGMPKDENKAADLYEQAAVHGVRDAVGRLESIAAHGGNPKARYVLGKMYEQGLGGVPKDENKAADLYEQAASAGVREVVPRLQSLAAPGGNPKAQYVLGRIYEGGWVGVGKDGEMARRMYEQAANAGVGEAAEPLGCLLSVLAMNERDRRRQDELNVQAIKWLTFASEQGRPRAQWFLALMYQDGLGGLDVDLDRAVHLLRSAAAQGFALAGCTLGDIYLHELSDFVEAERCYRKAAEHGDEAVSSQTLAGR